ncbi:MAG: uL15 family ribosomal protein [Patescibacteria group bacterium]
MQLNTLKRKTPNKKGRYVGRGGRRGKTAGRGTKGQKARAGAKFRPEIRDTIKRLPKLRGRGVNSHKSISAKSEVVNLRALEASFSAGETVSPQTLLAKKLVSRMGGQLPRVKILGSGDLSKKLLVEGCAVSAEAKVKIEKAGGKVKIAA